jgi:phosphoglycerate dehydrogenase-like enzyme
MNIIIAKAKSEFNKEDLKRLSKYNPVFYEESNNKFESLEALFSPSPKIFALKPGYLQGDWNSLSEDKLNKIPNLKALCLSTTSFSWVPVDYLRNNEIILTNVPGKSTESVAEFGVYMTQSLLRKIPLIVKNNWTEKKDFIGEELKGKKVGIVGFGAIGSRYADLCKSYGAEIYIYNRTQVESIYNFVDLKELCSNCDILFFATAVPKEVKGLISRKLIDSMQPHILIITIVDQELSDHEYIIEKVAIKKLGGYAFESETQMSEFEGNIFSVPEIAYYTKETLSNESKILTDSIISIIEGKPRNYV